MTDTATQNKARVWELQLKLSAAAGDPQSVHELLKGYLHENVVMHAMHPINELKGEAAVYENFWKPFVEAFPDLERHNDIFLAGNYKGDEWVSSVGHYVGTFYQDWLGIQASGKLLTLRFGEFCRIQNGKIKEIYLLIDTLDIMRQVNIWPLSFSLGTEGWWPKPTNNKGIILTAPDITESRMSLKLQTQWMDELKNFPDDTLNFDLLRANDYLHPRYMQYASSGLGAVRGFYGLREHFLKPFFTAFKQRKLGIYQTRFAEGNIVTSAGWQSIKARHSEKFLGFEASNNTVNWRTMQWWRRAGERIKENWLFIDLPHLLDQMGIDVFAAMRDTQAKDNWL